MAKLSRTLRAPLAALLLASAAIPAAAQSPDPGSSFSAATLSRLNDIEAELRRLTATLEDLDRRQRQQAEESELRLRDLEFRIIQLEGGDPSALFAEEGAAPAPTAPAAAPAAEPPAAETPAPPAQAATPQVADAPPAAAPTEAGDSTTAPRQATAPGPRPLGVIRQERGAAEASSYETAARRLAAEGAAGAPAADSFVADFPDSPRGGLLLHRAGEALAASGQHREAARRFLKGFRDYRTSPAGLDNLLGLGGSLAALGEMEDACAAFDEARSVYPNDAERISANAALAGCP